MADTKLYIGNLNQTISIDELRELFGQHGDIKEIKLFKEKGFGFVEMTTQQEAESARSALNGFLHEGRPIKVDIARPPKKNKRNTFRRF